MMVITHLSFALFLGLLITRLMPVQASSYLLVAFILLGSVLPDADNADSLVGRKVRIISIFLKHRGFLHSISFAVIIAIIIFLISNNSYYALSFIFGYLSHLFLDSLTRGGTAPFWPSKLRLKGPFRTKMWIDWVLLLGSIAGAVVIMLSVF